MENHFIENCFCLTTRDVLRNFFRQKRNSYYITDDRRGDISYRFDDPDDPSCLFIRVGNHESRAVGWEFCMLTFGLRSYFHCYHCNSRVAKLFLPPGGKEFFCKKCGKLRYQLESVNAKSVAGRAIHRFIKAQKLVDRRAAMSRIFYSGQYTKRFKRFIGMCARSGLSDIVKGADDLMTLVKTQ